MNKSKRRLVALAVEWANELSKFRGHELLVSEVTLWGFGEVERGRHPDIVLKEVLAKINERLPQSINLKSPSNADPPSRPL